VEGDVDWLSSVWLSGIGETPVAARVYGREQADAASTLLRCPRRVGRAWRIRLGANHRIGGCSSHPIRTAARYAICLREEWAGAPRRAGMVMSFRAEWWCVARGTCRGVSHGCHVGCEAGPGGSRIRSAGSATERRIGALRSLRRREA